MTRVPGGRLVVFEGVDGSGKSTLVAHVAARLAESAVDAVTTKEPTDSWLGAAVRKGIDGETDPVAEALLFMADHAAHVAWVRQQLTKDLVVLSDRWNDSCLAYQGVTLGDAWGRDPVDVMRYLERVAEPFDLRPHVVVWVDVPPEAAVARLAARSRQDKFERAQFLERVRDNYEWLSRRRGDYVRIDGARALHDVEADALRAVEAVVGRTLGGRA